MFRGYAVVDDVQTCHRDVKFLGGNTKRKDKEVPDNGLRTAAELLSSSVHIFYGRIEAVFHDKFGLPDRIAGFDNGAPNRLRFMLTRHCRIGNNEELIPESCCKSAIVTADVVSNSEGDLMASLH